MVATKAMVMETVMIMTEDDGDDSDDNNGDNVDDDNGDKMITANTIVMVTR